MTPKRQKAETAPILVRRMTEADLDAVCEIAARSFPDPWIRAMFEEELGRDGSIARVVIESERVLGFFSGWLIEGELHILNVAVHPEARRRGLGRKMIEHVLRRHEGRAFLEVRASNEGAIALYRDFGFSIIDVRKKYYPNNDEDALVMMRLPS